MNWESSDISYPNMSAILEQNGTDISPQALAKKAQSGAIFMRTLVESAIAQTSALVSNIQTVTVAGVNQIYHADSSIQKLNAQLAAYYPGTGSDAAAKIHLLFNYTQQTTAHVELTSGKTSDHELSEVYASYMDAGDLLIRDRGYFDTEHFQNLDDQGVFYLSRIPASVTHFYYPDGTRFDLWEHLARSRQFEHDFDLYVGDDQVLLGRVVALRLPRHEWQARVAKLAKEKGRPLTTTEKNRAKWNLYVTNLEREQASPHTVKDLYATRWQVELIFKAWKGNAGLTQIKNAASKAAMQTILWARLLFGIVNLYVRSLLQEVTGSEIPIVRWRNRITPHVAKMRDLFFQQRWLKLAHLYEKIARKFAIGEKRFRKTSIRNLRDSIALDIKTRNASMP